MKILIVGSLSWNPERVRSLCERGHKLWGLWSRSMAWDQGPCSATDGCVRPITLSDAAKTVRAERIDCIYSLFQSYHPALWGPRSAGVEHDVWTLLRELLLERQRGAFDAPTVRHWGFDIHNLDLDVARALDGHLFCNREKLDYFSTPVGQGGCGLEVFDNGYDPRFLDSDRPKLEFMNEGFSTPLSDRTGEIHTVCIGRPFNIDLLAAAARGIHVHLYCNGFDDTYRSISPNLSSREARKSAGLLRRYVHVHDPLQAIGADWRHVWACKSRWVEEFSPYDAGWSYVGSPLRWAALDDRAAIPNRIGTYVLAGLPVITDSKPGWYRYEELRRLGIDIELIGHDYDDLRSRLETEIHRREKRRKAQEQRHEYAFDATIDPLLSALEEAQRTYFDKAHLERSRFRTGNSPRLVPVYPSPGPGPTSERRRTLLVAWRSRRLARSLRLEGRPRDAPSTHGR